LPCKTGLFYFGILILHMKKVIIITAFLLLPLHIHAQEVAFPQNINEIKQKIDHKRNPLSERIELKKQELQQKRATTTDSSIQILTQEKVSKIIEHTFNKFEAVLVRFDGIVARLEVRISKLEQNNAGVVELKESLDKVKISIDDAYVLILASKEDFPKEDVVSLNKDEIKQSFAEYKKSLKNIQDSLLSISQSLRNKDNLEDEEFLSE